MTYYVCLDSHVMLGYASLATVGILMDLTTLRNFGSLDSSDVAFAAVQSLDPSLQFPVTKQAIISIVRSLEANQTTMALPNPVSVS